MNYKNLFIEYCEQSNIDYLKVFKNVYSIYISNGRVNCRCSYLNRKEDQLFVIGFSTTTNLYYAWRLSDQKKISTFSAKIEDTSEPNEHGIMFIDKSREYIGWGKEIVYVFNENHIADFLAFIEDDLNEITN
jgi:hypothetical protein